MSKLKDLFYDISDVIVAFCIVIVAGFVIWGSIGNIMDYPSMISASEGTGKNSNFGLAVPVDDAKTSGSAVDEKGNQASDKKDNQASDKKDNQASDKKGNQVTGREEDSSTDESTTDPYAVYINPGESATSIAKKFVAVGLFDSVEQFNTILNDQNAASKIKTGNFIIPADATPEEIITQITTTTGQ